MLVWSVIWENPGGRFLTRTLPFIRILCRIILTGKMDNSFDNVHMFLPLFKSSNSMLYSDSEHENDNGDEDEDWVIRRKPSNPDKKKRSFAQYVWGLIG